MDATDLLLLANHQASQVIICIDLIGNNIQTLVNSITFTPNSNTTAKRRKLIICTYCVSRNMQCKLFKSKL